MRASESAKAYGSYKELANDPNVDIIYVATPHSHHYQNAMLCLEAGKNVLCEKAFTTNVAQAEALVKKAKEKNVFLMEAVWTRCGSGNGLKSYRGLLLTMWFYHRLPSFNLRARYHHFGQDWPCQQDVRRPLDDYGP